MTGGKRIPEPTETGGERSNRDELIAGAGELFLTRGYDSTSVDDINTSAGVSKGTFYHYFRTKSDLLDAVVDELTDKGLSETRRAVDQTSGNAITRLNAFMAAAQSWRLVGLHDTAGVMRAAYGPGNSQLRERMRDRSIGLCTPALARLIRQGMEEGTFHADQPETTARVFLMLAYGVSEDMILDAIESKASDDELLELMAARGTAFYRAVEGLLGVSPGTLAGVNRSKIKVMIAAFSRDHTTEHD